MYKLVIATLLYSFIGSQVSIKKEYHRTYHMNGTIESEGWIMNEQKVGYWYQYYPNGEISKKGPFKNNQKNGYWYYYTSGNKVSREGHFINDKAENWWIIYDIAPLNKKTQITRKLQYHNNQKNGYCLLYKSGKLFKAEKYINDHKTGEWTDVFSFKRDNPNASL